jgi:putative DNA primase/helicase
MANSWDSLDALAAKVAAADVPAGPLPEKDGVVLIRGTNIKPQNVSWWWPGFIAKGKVHMLAGIAGTGKTTLGDSLLAIQSRDGHWPDGTPCSAARVAIWSGEDDPADTIIPRFLAAGGNPENLFILSGTREQGDVRPFDPATDSVMLMEALERIGGISMLMIDPIVSAVSGDSHKNTEVRRGLQPLVDLASALDIAILGVTHFSKGTSGREPLERLTGSMAFGAVARVVFCIAKGKHVEGEEQKRLFVRAKSNIGPDGGGFEYTIEQAPVPGYPDIFASRVVWGQELDGSAREVLSEAESYSSEQPSDEESETGAAERFVREVLADGTTPTSTVKDEAKEAGLAWRTVQRAADRVGVVRKKGGMREGWYWTLPKMPTKPEGANESCSAPSDIFEASSVPEALAEDF